MVSNIPMKYKYFAHNLYDFAYTNNYQSEDAIHTRGPGWFVSSQTEKKSRCDNYTACSQNTYKMNIIR